MLLLEHDAKTLLESAGVPVPPGCLTGTGAIPPDGPVVVKAQVPVGGRGKAGGIRAADDPQGVREAVTALVGMTIKGHVVRECRIERQVRGREVYLSLSIDPAAGGIRLLFAPEGGVEVEALHASRGVVRDALAAPDAASVGRGFDGLLAGPDHAVLSDAAARLATAFFRYEAKLLEINPLFLPAGGGWVAGDAKLILDPSAIPRQPAIEALLRARRDAYPEAFRKLDSGFDYVEIDPAGEIGLVTTGAGLSMMLIDELTASGLRPFNFCDIRTGQMRGDPKRLIEVLGWIRAGRHIRAILVNIFAGITHLGEFARLFVQAMAVVELRVPIVMRIIGNGFEEARAIIADSGLAMRVEPDLDRAVAAVAQAGLR
jgi:succinyl-CoA synthetase beta subunit